MYLYCKSLCQELLSEGLYGHVVKDENYIAQVWLNFKSLAVFELRLPSKPRENLQ